MFIRERADGLYSVFAYLMNKVLEEVILAAATSVVFSASAFYAIGYEGSFATYWVVYYLTLCTGIVLAYLVAAISPSMEVANAALPAYVVTLLFFVSLRGLHAPIICEPFPGRLHLGVGCCVRVLSFRATLDTSLTVHGLPAACPLLGVQAGQLITFNTMPPWWKWYSYIDFLRYAWGALMVSAAQQLLL